MEDLKGIGTPPISHEEREELERLRKEHAKLKLKVSDKHKHEKQGAHSDDDSEDSSEVDLIN